MKPRKIHIVYMDGTYHTFGTCDVITSELDGRVVKLWRRRWLLRDKLIFTFVNTRWASFDPPPEHLIVR